MKFASFAAKYFLILLFISFGLSPAFSQEVKRSSSGICHCPGGAYYDRTVSNSLYSTLNECLATGAREPRKGQGKCPGSGAVRQGPSFPDARLSKGSGLPPARGQDLGSARAPAAYKREYFGGWRDANKDCRNTRAEVLISLSTSAVRFRKNGCTVDRGRWNDPYTGKIFFEASDIDIDHLVPLAWAWDRGAWNWDEALRVKFSNDHVNLFAVEASANRKKGASGPLAWLPPDIKFRCAYVTRFERVVRIYGLSPSDEEARAMNAQRAKLCSN